MASVFLTDVDDYIGSSQACVNPLFTSGAGSSDDKDGGAKKDGVDGDGKNSDGKGGAGAVRLDLDDANAAPKSTPSVIPATSDSTRRHAAVANPRTRRRRPRKRITLQSNPMPPPADGGSNSKGKEKERATVSVADCLACSGCVTSAEAVLVDRHSIPTLRANCRPPLRDGRRLVDGGGGEDEDGDDRLIAFTISPAVVADLTRLLYLERRGHDNIGNSASTDDAAAPDEQSRRHRLAEEATKVLRKLATFLHGELGADVVIDGGAVADVSLVESAEEFVHRYRQGPLQCAPSPSRNGGGGGLDGDVDGAVPLPIRLPEQVRPPTPSVAISATETRIVHRRSPSPPSSSPSSPSDAVTVRHEAGRPATPPPNGDVAPSPLPVLTSSCPGFVCYVEKTAPHCVPHLSSAKSPMAVSGYLLKHRTSDLLPCLSPPPPSIPSPVPPSPTGGGGGGDARKNKLDEGGVGRGGGCYHVAIMPCHDKKLEASRRDLAWRQIMGEDDPVPDVDLVITTTELVELISEAAEAEADAEVGEGGESEGGGGEGAENEAGGGTTMSVMEYFENIPPAPLWHCGDGSSLAPTGAPDGCRETELSPPTTGGEGGVRADDAEEKKSEPNSQLIPSSSSHRAMGGGTDGGGVSLLLKVDRHHEEGGGESPAAPLRWASPTATASTGGGGSHADHVFRRAALDLFGFRIPPDRALPWRSAGGGLGGRRNDDDDGAGGGGVGGRRRVVVRRRRRGADGGGREQRQSSRLSDFREVALYRHHDGTYSMDPTARGGANAEQSANGDVVSSAVTTGGTADAGGAADTPAAVPVLRFAAAYGFRNIQGLVQRMKKNAKTDQRRTVVTISEQGDTGGSCDYHYVEAMACPSGCVNGGGQVRSRSLGDERLTGTKPPKKERPAEMRERAGKTNSILDSRCVQAPDTEGGECPSLVRAVYRGRVDVDDGRGADAAEESSRGDGGVDRRPADDDPWGPFSGEARRTLHTRFHAVPKLELSTGAVAGVSLSDTKW